MRKYILHAFPIRKLVIVALEFPKKNVVFENFLIIVQIISLLKYVS